MPLPYPTQEVSHVVHQSRPKKLKGASDEQARKQQLGEIGFSEKRALRKVVERVNGLPVAPAEAVLVGEFYSAGRENRSGNRNDHGVHPVAATQSERSA